VVTFLQHAAKEALENAPASEASLALMVGEYQKRRDTLVEGLNQMKGLELRTPEGAFYVFPDFGHFIPSDLEPQKRSLYIYEHLMSRGVATVYGSCFGKHFANNIRISFSTTPANAIREGLMRIAEAFA
jgi:aspartate aminotransferase